MSIATPADLRAAAHPFDALTALRTLDLTTSNATISLAAGVWEVFLPSTAAIAVASLTGTTASMPPATGAAEVTGFVLAPGGVMTIALAVATTLNARVTSGTATLYLHRKALS